MKYRKKSIFPIYRKSVVRAQPIYILILKKKSALSRRRREETFGEVIKSRCRISWAIYLCVVLWKVGSVKSKRYIHGWREKSIREVNSMRPVSMENKLRATARHSRSSSVVCFSHDVIAAEPQFTADLFFLHIPYTLLYPLYWSAWWCYCCVIYSTTERALDESNEVKDHHLVMVVRRLCRACGLGRRVCYVGWISRIRSWNKRETMKIKKSNISSRHIIMNSGRRDEMRRKMKVSCNGVIIAALLEILAFCCLCCMEISASFKSSARSNWILSVFVLFLAFSAHCRAVVAVLSCCWRLKFSIERKRRIVIEQRTFSEA